MPGLVSEIGRNVFSPRQWNTVSAVADDMHISRDYVDSAALHWLRERLTEVEKRNEMIETKLQEVLAKLRCAA